MHSLSDDGLSFNFLVLISETISLETSLKIFSGMNARLIAVHFCPDLTVNSRTTQR